MRLYALRASIKLFNVVAILYVLVEPGEVILLTVFFCEPSLPKNPTLPKLDANLTFPALVIAKAVVSTKSVP